MSDDQRNDSDSESNDNDEREYRYEKLPWPELDWAANDGKMIVIPTAVTEQHGPHLPVDVDQLLTRSICEGAVRDRDDSLLYPTITQGYVPHQMDFPGGVTLGWQTFVNQLIDIGVSLAHHRFSKILFVNGHGSNDHLVQQAARQIMIQYPDTQAAMLSWWDIEEFREVAREIRDTGPSGTAHGGETETSLYLYLDPDRVDMDKATRDIIHPESEHFWVDDLAGEREPDESTPVKLMEMFSKISETGTRGDPTVASAEKGEQFYEAAVTGLHSILDEFGSLDIVDVDDKHTEGPRDPSYDAFKPR